LSTTYLYLNEIIIDKLFKYKILNIMNVFVEGI